MGITKQEAAKRMNMSQPAYLRYESGTRTPSIHVINSMANVLIILFLKFSDMIFYFKKFTKKIAFAHLFELHLIQ